MNISRFPLIISEESLKHFLSIYENGRTVIFGDIPKSAWPLKMKQKLDAFEQQSRPGDYMLGPRGLVVVHLLQGFTYDNSSK